MLIILSYRMAVHRQLAKTLQVFHQGQRKDSLDAKIPHLREIEHQSHFLQTLELFHESIELFALLLGLQNSLYLKLLDFFSLLVGQVFQYGPFDLLKLPLE